MQLSFVIAAIPTIVKAIVLVLACLAGGFFGGFFLFRMRFKKELGLYEARETALKNREEESARIQASLKPKQVAGGSVNPEATIEMLREDLEQRSIELGIAQQEFELELLVLREEIATLKGGGNKSRLFPVEVVDVEFESTESSELPGEAVADVDDEIPGSTTDDAEQQQEPPISEEDSHEEQKEKRVQHTEEPAETVKNAVDWATSVISDLLGDFLPLSSGENGGAAVPAESEIREEELLPETVGETSGEFVLQKPIYPRFRSLVNFVSLDDLTNGNAEKTKTEPLKSNAEEAGLQVLLDLTDPHFHRLKEMGFASYEHIAELTTRDIHRLAEEFQIPIERIEKVWISGAQLRLFEGD